MSRLERTTGGIAPIRATTLWAEALRVLREAILTGRLQPGAKLVEADLARELGVSRNPVREALGRLEQQGLVTVIPNQGAFVVRPTPAQMRDALMVRSHLELLATRLALANPDAGKFDRLRQIVDELEGLQRATALPPADRLGRAALLDAAFHQHLVHCSCSETLQRIWDLIAPLDLVFVFELAQQLEYEDAEARMEHEVTVHRRLLEALLSGDARQAERGIQEHFEAGAPAPEDGHEHVRRTA
jgi:DNA-binding GntR family transcriptional regulator